jgi:hypothetical protein
LPGQGIFYHPVVNNRWIIAWESGLCQVAVCQ